MIIYVENVMTTAFAPSPAERDVLCAVLTVYGKWDFMTGQNKVCNFYAVDAGNIVFGTGLLDFILQTLASYGFTINLCDRRRKPYFEQHYKQAEQLFTPYGDQEIVADLMLKRGRGVLNLATNYGKTYLYMRCWKKLQCPNMLIVVPTQALLYQVRQDFAKNMKLNVDEIGMVGDGKFEWRPFTVAIIDSVNLWLNMNKPLPYYFDMLIVDEGHLATSGEYQRLTWACDAPFRFWCSGTAYKDGDKIHEFSITSLSGPCIANVKNDYLVHEGRSSRPLIRFVNNYFHTNELIEDWREQYTHLKKDKERNSWIVEAANMANELNLTTMIFCEHIDNHAMELGKMIPSAMVVKGGSAGVNEKIKKKLLSGELKTVICTSTWRVGVSIPGVNVLIQGCGGRAIHNRAQEFGRVLRKSELGHCYYVDFNDLGLSHVQKQAKARFDAMKLEGFGVKIVNKLEELFTTEELAIAI